MVSLKSLENQKAAAEGAEGKRAGADRPRRLPQEHLGRTPPANASPCAPAVPTSPATLPADEE